MVTEISESVRKALRALIVRSIEEGIEPREAARMIRGMVGMTVPQSQAAMNYRRFLIDSGVGKARVEAMLARYVRKKITERALTIARFEIMDALNKGSRRGWLDAQKKGLLGPNAKREWMTGSMRPCPTCESMNGVQVLLGQNFPVAGPPAHPRCRCSDAVVP